MLLDNFPYLSVTESHKLIAKHYGNLLSQSMRHHHKNYDDWCNVQGMLGEVALAHLLGCLPAWRKHKDTTSNLESKWDDGFDMEYQGLRIDCKVLGFRNPNAIQGLGIFRGDHNGADIYVQMLINQNELYREKGINSIDWIDKIWCAGFIEADEFKERYNGRLRYPIKDLKPITLLS